MIRTRISATVAALLLVAASVFMGVLPAQAYVTEPPVITSTGGSTVDQAPLILGTFDNPNATSITVNVSVTNSGGTFDYCSVSVNYTDPVWGCSGAALPYGANSFSAVASEYTTPLEVSGSSAAVVYTIGGTQPAVLTTPAALTVTSDATPTFSGTGPSLGLIDVNRGGGATTTLCLAPVDALGNWSCTASQPLDLGVYTVRADPTRIDGSPAEGTASQSLQITAPPPPTVDQTFIPWVTSASTRDIQGNKDADVDYLQVYTSPDGVAWTPYCQSTGVIGATIWFCDPPFSAASLGMGTNLVAAIAFNEASTPSTLGPSITIDRVPPPTIGTPAEGVFTSDPTPTFVGSSSTGTNVTVYNLGSDSSFCSSPIVGGTYACDASPLADGEYGYLIDVKPGDAVASGSRTFTVDTVAPDAPVITGPGTTTTSTHPAISGTAEPFSVISVYRDGTPAACQEGVVVASSAGTWSCTSSAPLGVGRTFDYGAAQTDRAGNLSDSGVPPTQLALTVLAPAAPHPLAPTPVTTPPPAPIVFQAWTFAFSVGADELQPGDTTQLSGAGLPAGAIVDVELHSTPVALGSTMVEPDGTFSMLVTIPEDVEAGEHHFVVTVTPAEGLPSTQEQAITVKLPVKEAAGPAKELPTLAMGDDVPSGADRSDPAAPSSLTDSIDTIGAIMSNPVVLGTAAIAGLALLLLVAFPAELLNSTISEQYPRFSRRIPKAPWLERFTNWLEATPLFGGVAITIAAAVIFGFADPGFGFDVTSLRVVLACTIALFIVGYLASTIAGRIIHRRWRLDTVMELKPLGLALAVVGVVLSRLIDFSPGFLIGLLLGIALVGHTTVEQRAKATLVQAGVVFVLAVLGWIGYSILSATTAPDSFLTSLAFDTMVAVTTEGLTALFIGLLPFKFLDGASVFEHSTVLWAVSYAIAAAAFVLIVVPAAWGELDGSLWLWITVVGAFAIVASGIYVYFRFFAKPIDEDEEEPVLEDARS